MTDWLKTPEPGIYYDVPEAEYHRWDAMSASWLGTLQNTSPKHFRHFRERPRKPTKAERRGSCFHKLLWEPFAFPSAYVVEPEADKRTKAGKVMAEAFEKTIDGRIAVPRAEYLVCKAMADALSAHWEKHPLAAKLRTGGKAEVSVVWDDPDTGIRCKVRLDWLVGGIIVDAKSTASARPDDFMRSIWQYGYHRQAGMYLDGLQAVTGQDGLFLFAAVESDAPFDCIIRPAGKTVLMSGRDCASGYKFALRTYKHCLDTGVWPGYDDGTLSPLELPKWAQIEEGIAPIGG